MYCFGVFAHFSQFSMYAWGEKRKNVSFSRVYVCVKAKLTFVSFFSFLLIAPFPYRFVQQWKFQKSSTWILVRGSIFCTGPVQVIGRATSRVWPAFSKGIFSGWLLVIPKLFLFSWMPKPCIACIALLLKVISIVITLFLRLQEPDISSPLPFCADSHTWKRDRLDSCKE